MKTTTLRFVLAFIAMLATSSALGERAATRFAPKNDSEMSAIAPSLDVQGQAGNRWLQNSCDSIVPCTSLLGQPGTTIFRMRAGKNCTFRCVAQTARHVKRGWKCGECPYKAVPPPAAAPAVP